MLTVLLPTHNGTDTLGRTLEALCGVIAPAGGWKLLVVNNASTDNTEELVLSFRGRLPLEYLVEPRLGKPYALNTGLDHVEGDLVVFTDDDVLPDPDWLVAWRSAVERHPKCSIFGGAIEPLYERDPPQWLFRTSWWGNLLFAKTDPLPAGPISPGSCIYGPNMAVRTTALTDETRFDQRFQIGPIGLLGDEIDFVYRLAARGNQACFAPGTRVRHIVNAGQLQLTWLLRRFYRQGKMLATFEAQRNRTQVRKLFHVPRWQIRRALTSCAILPFVLPSFDRFRVFSRLAQLASALGAIAQSRALHQDPQWRDLTSPSVAADPTGGPLPRIRPTGGRADGDASEM